jgi:hypothetical protein
MPTHLHLQMPLAVAAQTPFLRRLNQAYAKKYNEAEDASGTVFEPKTWVFDRSGSEEQIHVKGYIDSNPSKDSLVADPANYEFSSYRATLGLVPKPAWLDDSQVLRLFSENRERAVAEYRDYVGNLCNAYSRMRFVRRVGSKWASELDDFKTVTAGLVLENLQAALELPSGITKREIQLHLLSKISPVTQGEMAKLLGCPRSTIGDQLKRLKERIVLDAAFVRELEVIIGRLLRPRMSIRQ